MGLEPTTSCSTGIPSNFLNLRLDFLQNRVAYKRKNQIIFTVFINLTQVIKFEDRMLQICDFSLRFKNELSMIPCTNTFFMAEM